MNYLLALLLFLGASTAWAQKVEYEVVTFAQLQEKMKQPSEDLRVVNFWATWCKPCVAELPYFEQLAKNYADKKVKVWLVSLDFPDEYEKTLKPFINRKKLTGKVLALNDTDYNSWVRKIDARWQGSIPATLILNQQGDKVVFRESDFESYEDLVKFIAPFLK